MNLETIDDCDQRIAECEKQVALSDENEDWEGAAHWQFQHELAVKQRQELLKKP